MTAEESVSETPQECEVQSTTVTIRYSGGWSSLLVGSIGIGTGIWGLVEGEWAVAIWAGVAAYWALCYHWRVHYGGMEATIYER